MELETFIQIESHKVRSNPELMAFYIATFEQTFGYKPDCVGCSFTSDFQKLKNKLKSSLNPSQGGTFEQKNNTTMKNMKPETQNLKRPKAPFGGLGAFILRQKKGEILTYRKDDYTFRCYDYNLTEEFVLNFLTHGTEEELQERKKMFSKIPVLPNSPQPPKGDFKTNNKKK